MPILVTGGSGFIGSKLVVALCDAGHHVRIISRNHEFSHEDNARLELVNFDLMNWGALPDTLLDGCSLIFNCAGSITNESSMRALHVDATRNLIDACKRKAVSTKESVHWVQLSSVGAYGPVQGKANAERVVTEVTPPNPVGEYEITKSEADEILLSAVEPGIFSCSILRPSNVYGSGMPNGSLRQWGNAVRNHKFVYIGAKGAISTYVHVDDVVSALVLCGFNRSAVNEIFNISNDCPQEVLVRSMAMALGVPPPRLRVPESVARIAARLFSRVEGFPLTSSRIDSLVARTRYPSEKLKDLLDFYPVKSIEENVSEILFENLGLR